MVCLSFPPMSASRLVTPRSSTQPRPWFHAALLHLILWSLSAGRTLALGRTYARVHDGGAGSRHPAVTPDNRY